MTTQDFILYIIFSFSGGIIGFLIGKNWKKTIINHIYNYKPEEVIKEKSKKKKGFLSEAEPELEATKKRYKIN